MSNRRQEALQEFRDNPLVIATLIRMNVEMIANGHDRKALLPAPPEVVTALEQIESQQFEVADKVAKLVRRFGFQRVKAWMQHAGNAPHDHVATVRFAVQRSMELDEELLIRQPAIWFVPIWQTLIPGAFINDYEKAVEGIGQ